MDEGLGKTYMLCSKRVIEELFRSGQSIKQYPFVLHFMTTGLQTDKKFQIVTSVPKRLHKKAVKRNRIKRLMREVIRKKKFILEEGINSEDKQLALFLIYTGKKEENYSFMLNKIETLFERLTKTEKEPPKTE